ncbi:threonine efflux protein [Niallia circulans]|nr:amino acid transporter [Shouchella clausii]SPT77659.1 threonine efflux protein [Niallia circulans]
MVFLSYIMLGISLAAPIGPVNAAQVEKGIKGGFMNSWAVGLGAMAADALYMFAVFLGVSRFLEYEVVTVFLWLFGCFVLVYTGCESIMKVKKEAQTGLGVRTKESPRQSFQIGFLISISNPLTILFWLGIYGSVLAKTISEYEMATVWLYSVAIFIGIAAWDFTMAVLSSTARAFMNEKALIAISAFSGVCLIGFGVYFGYHGIALLFG